MSNEEDVKAKRAERYAQMVGLSPVYTSDGSLQNCS